MLAQIGKPPPHQHKKNLIQLEIKAMRGLYTNPNITMEPADKGGSVIIMETTDYIHKENVPTVTTMKCWTLSLH